MTEDISTHDAEDDPRNADLNLYVNGEILHRNDAKVSVYDSGFLLGDGVWEGLRLYNGKWTFLNEHMERLFEAAKAIDLDIGKTRSELITALNETAAANDMADGVHARLMVTRGVKSKPFQDPRLSKSGPTIVIIMEFSSPVTGRALQDPKLNSHSKLNCILAGIHAQKAGADEALMLDPQGFVNTTNSCNFFIVRKEEVWTSNGDYCMNGITRRKTIELCRANDISVTERNFSLVDTYGADEAFITGTFGAQTPVCEIDGRLIGDGGAGPVTQRLQQLYKTLVS
jgi:branched-chain amino acid aminotransferase